MNQPLLQVRNLSTQFFTRDGVVKAVDDVSFSVEAGQVLGVVGESGCGKSVTSLSIMQLVPHPGRITQGSIEFDGEDLIGKSKNQIRDLRGDRIAMIFQQPTSSLNPVMRVEDQITEVMSIHTDLDKKQRKERMIELLESVGIPDPHSRARAFPHELSGGMAQRVMIAMALASDPALLIADEPTTALDVTIQAQILDLIRTLNEEHNTAVVLITHDLGVVAEMADAVAVMYAGQIVEEADVATLYGDPKHPYTQGLIGSIPVLGQPGDELDTIPGVVPSLIELGEGCRFASRCVPRLTNGLEQCLTQSPPLIQLSSGQNVRCWLYEADNE